MNDYYDKYLADRKAWSYQEWLIDKLEKAEKNIYDLLAIQALTQNRYAETATCAREFIDAIRKSNNKLARYKMLELETFLEEYERKKRPV